MYLELEGTGVIKSSNVIKNDQNAGKIIPRYDKIGKDNKVLHKKKSYQFYIKRVFKVYQEHLSRKLIPFINFQRASTKPVFVLTLF